MSPSTNRSRRRARVGGAALVSAVLGSGLAGCGADAEVTLVEGEVVEVQALDNIFRPEDVVVPAGAVVRWENVGRQVHNVIPIDSDVDFTIDADDLEPGDVGEFRFTEPGEYRYYCSLHGTERAGMIGSIVVDVP